jgi:hypothetical protein
MPVLKYFLFVGGSLLALLFAIDAYIPKEPAVTAAEAGAPSDNPTLRIRSDRKWPERIVFDTSAPTIVPPVQTAAAEVSQPAQPTTPASEFTAKARVRESFAQFKPTEEASKPEAKPQPKRKVARHRAPATPQVALIAQQPPRFGLFGNNFFANNGW